MSKRNRYEIYDRRHRQAKDLMRSGTKPYAIVDRTTNSPVDECSTLYEARMTLKQYNEMERTSLEAEGESR